MVLEVRWPSGKRHLLDITIRSTFAQGIPRDASPGRAAVLGEDDERRQYGETGGTDAIEPYGRMGAVALEVVAQQWLVCCGLAWRCVSPPSFATPPRAPNLRRDTASSLRPLAGRDRMHAW